MKKFCKASIAPNCAIEAMVLGATLAISVAPLVGHMLGWW